MPLKCKPSFVASEPRCFVVGAQQILDRGLIDFLDSERFPDWATAAKAPSEVLIEVAGRLCYLSFGGGRDNVEYVENLKRDRHGSVLEHAVVNLIFTGVSRSFTHEIVRHRAGWSYSQLSQRFVGEQLAQMVCPGVIWECRDDPKWHPIYTRWVAATRAARDAYESLVTDLSLKLDPPEQGGRDRPVVKRQTRWRKAINGAARSVLPNATETKIFATVNARAFRHFLEMRATEAADAEIRAVAMAAYRAVLPHWPNLLSDYQVRLDEDGQEFLATEFLKV